MSIPLLIRLRVERDAHSDRGASGERGADWPACRRAHRASSGAPASTRRPAWASQARSIARASASGPGERAEAAGKLPRRRSGPLPGGRGSSFALHPGAARESGGTHPAPVSWQLRLRARGDTQVRACSARLQPFGPVFAIVPRARSAAPPVSGALPLLRNPSGKVPALFRLRATSRGRLAGEFRAVGMPARRLPRCSGGADPGFQRKGGAGAGAAGSFGPSSSFFARRAPPSFKKKASASAGRDG